MKHRRYILIAMVAVFCMANAVTPAMARPGETAKANTATAAKADTLAGLQNKDEVIYGSITSSGDVKALYAVNRFEIATAGKLTDFGDYSSVINLTNTQPVSHVGSEVEFTADAGNFYYQGNMNSTDLPWVFILSYKLDGAEIQHSDVAGATGKLEISIKSRANTKVNKTFYDNYMLQITATLDTEKCAGITAADSTIANAGKNKAVAFTVLPGKDADFTITADVTDFEMDGISISAVPYSMSIEFPDMEDSFDDLEQLPEAISELNSGVGEMDSGSNNMKKGADQLVSGSSGIKSGLSMLSGRSGQLVSGSAQIKSGLNKIATELNNSGLNDMDLSGVSQLPDGLNTISENISKVSGGLTELGGGYSQAYPALDGAISGIPAAGVTQEQIAALYGAVGSVDPAMVGVLEELVANYTAAQTVKGTYAQVKPALAAVSPALESSAGGLNELAGGLSSSATEISGQLSQLDKLSQLGELQSGINQLSTNYSSFHSGLNGYTDGVGKISSNYGSFHSGLASFSKGVGELSSGIGELHEGTSTLEDEVEDLPEMIQEEIDKIKEQYLPADFETVSFTSDKNKNVEFVQFVIQGDAIEVEEPEVEQPQEEETKDETFWDRFLALFGGGN